MPSIYTIGYKGKPLATFIGQLRQAGVDAVIDVRLRSTSHLAGYTKRDDLAFLLCEGFAIAAHQPVTPEALSELKGVGPRKLEKYGTVVIELVRKYIEGGTNDSQTQD